MVEMTDGKCEFCKEIFDRKSMPAHLKSCKARRELLKKASAKSTKKEDYYMVSVEGFYSPRYWLYVDIPQSAEIGYLDEFLRRIWLECCNHGSCFYTRTNPRSRRMNIEIDMDDRIGDVLQYRQSFIHIYDFGSSTELKLKIVSKFEGPKRKEKVRLLARNLPPLIKCSVCGEPAKNICTECRHSENAILCKKCSKKHECGTCYYLPVINSPRMGVCGYDGH